MTSIQVSCRLVANKDKKAVENKVSVVENHISNASNDFSYDFAKVFLENAKNIEVYTAVVDDLVKYFFAGYNTCLLSIGEARVQNSSLNDDSEFMYYVIEQVHNEYVKRLKLKESRKSSSRASKKNVLKDAIVLKICEVEEEKLTDLLLSNGSSSTAAPGVVEILEDDFDGVVIKNSVLHPFSTTNLKENQQVIYSACNNQQRLNNKNTHSNPLLVELTLTKHAEGLHVPITSWFRFIVLTSKTLEEDIGRNQLSVASDAPSSSSRVDFCNNMQKILNFQSSESLQTLMSDVLGGNCVTKMMLTMEPNFTKVNRRMMNMGMQVKKIYNYPVENSPHVKGLIRHYRMKVKELRHNQSKEKLIDEAFVEELKGKFEEARHTNQELSEENNRLDMVLQDTKEKYSQAVVMHTEVSSKNVFSSAEKLQMSKEVIDLRLQTNMQQQDAEKQVFEIRNKLLTEQEKSSKLERNLAFERKTHRDLEEKFQRLKSDYEELLEEYVNLKSNYQIVNTKFQQQTQVNEELTNTVAQLSELKDQILEQHQGEQFQQIKNFNEHLIKMRNSLAMCTENTAETDDLSKFAPKHFPTAKTNFNEDEIHKLQGEHHSELQALEKTLFSLKKTLNENEETISQYKTKLATVTSRMLLMQDEKKLVDSQLSERETILAKISHEYKTRLKEYVKDLTEYISSASTSSDTDCQKYKEHIEKMLTDLKLACNSELLTHQDRIDKQANMSAVILDRHEKLLVAYRMLMQKHGDSYKEDDILTFDIMLPPDSEIQAKQTRERNELRTKLVITEEKLKEYEDKMQKLKLQIRNLEENSSFQDVSNGGSDPWNGVRRKVQEFTSSVQHKLEKEKAELLTRCHLAEQQLESYYEHVEEIQRKYEFEIKHLQQQLYENNRNKNFYTRNLENEKNGFLPPIPQINYQP